MNRRLAASVRRGLRLLGVDTRKVYRREGDTESHERRNQREAVPALP
jgi:hypothetical protein